MYFLTRGWPNWGNRGALLWWRQLGSGLWKDCYEDSTALVNCVDFGVLWTVKRVYSHDKMIHFYVWFITLLCLWSAYIQAVRGLLMIGLCLGVLATVLTFFGLECTHIRWDHRWKHSMLMMAAAVHLLGCEYNFSEHLHTGWSGFSSFLCHQPLLMQAYQTWQLTVYT